MKKTKSGKLLTLDIETMKNITGGFPGTLGPTTLTLRTATVSCQCPGGPGQPPDVA